MKQLICEMCGSNSLVKQGEFFICESCGTKYTVEAAKKLMIEGTVDVKGTVKVDNSAFVEKYLANARRALDKEDWEEVEKYYNMVEQNSPTNMEAVFFSAYGKAMLSLFDSDYYKREQKFHVFMKSISVINECYEKTNEDKETVLRRMWAYIKKMETTNFVFNPSYALGTGSRSWCILLLRQARSAFLIELKQIAEVDDAAYVRELIDEVDPPKQVKVKVPAKDAAVRGKAIRGMIFGIVGCYFSFLVFGVIFCMISLITVRSIRKEYPGTTSAKMSLVATIVSIVGFALGAVMLLAFILSMTAGGSTVMAVTLL